MADPKRLAITVGIAAMLAVVAAGCANKPRTLEIKDFSVESFLKTVERRDVKMAELFLERGMDVNAKGEDGKTALLIAAKHDDADMVRTLIKAGADLKTRYRYGNTVLHEAVNSDSVSATEALLSAEVELEAKDEHGKTPLHVSASFGRKTTPLLIQAGADPNAKNRDGETALMAAALTGELESVRMLADAKADVNVADKQGNTALINAAGMLRSRMESFKVGEEAVTAMVERLLAAGADPKAKTKRENATALHEAAREGHTQAAALLVKAGAKVDATTKPDKFTPLMEAAKAGNAELVQLLLQSGAKPKLKDRMGRTAVNWAADYPEIVALLGGKPSKNATKVITVSPEKKDQAKQKLEKLGYREFNESMFVMSAHKGELEAAKAFLEYGLSVDSKDPRDHATTPLLAASMTPDSPELGIFLIRAGANVNAGDTNGSTPLLWAVHKCGMKDLVKELVKAGANVNAKAAGGATPLMMAEIMKCTEIVKILKKAGAKK